MKKTSIRFFAKYALIFIMISCQVSRPTSDTSQVQPRDLTGPGQSDTVVSDTVVIDEDEIIRIQPVYKGSYTRKHDLIHTKLEVSFDWEKQYLNGIATLELKPYFYPQAELVLDAKGFNIHQVSMVDSSGNFPLEYTYDSLKLNVDLGREFTRDERFIVEIKYTAKPNELNRIGSSAIIKDIGLYFINPTGSDPDKPRQIWTQGETEASSAWFPTIDSPNERTTQEMYITVDKAFTTLSNGELIYSQLNENDTRTDYWKMDLNHAPYLFMMAIGEFAVVEDSWQGLPVNYYVEPEYEKYAKDIFGNTPEMLSFFSEKFDYKYPWPKYSQVVVRDYVSGAMENTSASLYMEALQVDDRELLDENWDYIIAHETIHQWFGDLVTAESWANLPLNEALANYGEYLWNEYKYGLEEADYHGMEELAAYLKEAESKEVDLIRFDYGHRDDMFDNHSYAKGGRVLHMLRKYVGDEAFFESLSYYLKVNEFSPVEIHHLRLAFEKITGEDLNWFFNQWFLASGHPRLKVEKSYKDGKLKLKVWQTQDFSTAPLFKLPLYVDIWANKIKSRYAVVIDDSYEEFEFEVSTEPELVIFDGEKQLLAEIQYNKQPEELIYQFNNTDKFLARYEALGNLVLDSINNERHNVLMDALNDPFWAIRQFAINAFEGYKGENLVKVEDKLRELSLKDKKSLVRAEAVSVLATIGPDKHRDIFIKGLKDQAYSVIGASLFAYSQTNASDKKEVLEQFESYNNPNIMIPLADHYSGLGLPGKFDWFVNKVNEMQDADQYYMLQYFGQYLMKMDENQKRQGVTILEEIARNNSTFYIRLAAYQALGMIDEIEGVKQLMSDIKAQEKDKRLLDIYANM